MCFHYLVKTMLVSFVSDGISKVFPKLTKLKKLLNP